jgi:hypothetical protein
MASFTLTIDTPPLPPGILQKGAPLGVTVSHPPMRFARGMHAESTTIVPDFDITISVDPAVATVLVSAWICRTFNSSRFHLNPRINGQPLPPGQADVLEMITDAIQAKA